MPGQDIQAAEGKVKCVEAKLKKELHSKVATSWLKSLGSRPDVSEAKANSIQPPNTSSWRHQPTSRQVDPLTSLHCIVLKESEKYFSQLILSPLSSTPSLVGWILFHLIFVLQLTTIALFLRCTMVNTRKPAQVDIKTYRKYK